ncbi:MAG: hypothetical protein KDC00_05405 [Flavobacteriales bacterium]|nr:hypothetical protein [Flavobacteriales bacterium]
MIKQLILIGALLVTTCSVVAQKKSEIIPRDSITDKYAYMDVVTVEGATLEQLTKRLEKWEKQHYNPVERQYASVVVDGDSHTLHDREALPGKARKFIEYDLTVDMKDGRYRYNLTHLEFVAVGKYPLEDKMATDKRSDLEEIHAICERILASLGAEMSKGDDW